MTNGPILALFNSKMTSWGAACCISASATSADRAKTTGTPRPLAVVLIFEVNMRSSRTASIILTIMIIESQAVGPFFKNGFVVACESTRDAVFIDPGDEVESLL